MASTTAVIASSTTDFQSVETDEKANVATIKMPVEALPPVPLRCWVILFISSAGVLMAAVSTTALVIAFPALLQYLDASINTMLWILLVIFLMVGGVVGIAGKLGDLIGQATLYKFGYFMFISGNLIAGFAQKQNHGMDLLAARVIIGFGAAFLFVNSTAILTNAFAPYGRVGIAMGIYQLASASGTVLGPVIGGALANNQWHWIFWWNVPVGGLAFLLSLWAVNENNNHTIRKTESTLKEFARKFDWIGAFFYPLGLVLVLLALIQIVIPSKNIADNPGNLAGLIIAGVACSLIFIIDQFYAVDPIVPPDIFLRNKIFTVTTITSTCSSFVRNSITFNFIFYLQGPKSLSPLTAGLMLIPFGIGIMIAGFSAGAITDKVKPRVMTILGPAFTLAAVCTVVIYFDQHTNTVTIGGLLFLAGIGLGLFNSPNVVSNMLSVQREQRGVAAAVTLLTQMFTSMLAIVLTFSFVLNSLSQADLFNLFIFGGASLSASVLRNFLLALNRDWYIVIGALVLTIVMSCFNDFDPQSVNNNTSSSSSQNKKVPAATTVGEEEQKFSAAAAGSGEGDIEMAMTTVQVAKNTGNHDEEEEEEEL
jgi:MFS family permease